MLSFITDKLHWLDNFGADPEKQFVFNLRKQFTTLPGGCATFLTFGLIGTLLFT